MTTPTDRFLSLVDQVEATGRIPEVSGLASADRAALDVAHQLFAQRVELAPPAMQWPATDAGHVQRNADRDTTLFPFPTLSTDAARPAPWPRWLSGAAAAAIVVALVALARSGAVREPGPVVPARGATPAGLGIVAPTADSSRMATPVGGGATALPTGSGPTGRVTPLVTAAATPPAITVATGVAATFPAKGAIDDADPIPSSDGDSPRDTDSEGAPPTTVEPELPEPEATAQATAAPTQAATRKQTEGPPPASRTPRAPATTTAPPPPTRPAATSTAPPSQPPPPLQTMVPLPTDAPPASPTPPTTP